MEKKSFFVLVLALIILGLVGISWNLIKLAQLNIETSAIQDASRYSEAISEFRSVYTSEVVERVRSLGVEVTQDYEKHSGAIPLPITLTMALGKQLAKKNNNLEFRVFSNYPFPNRVDGRPQDDFEHDAIDALEGSPERPFIRFEEVNGKQYLRYAAADIMRKECLACHNGHPDSPKSDWKEGDVRGVLEVVLPVEGIFENTPLELWATLATAVFMTLLGGFGIHFILRNLRRLTTKQKIYASDLEKQIQERKETEILLKQARDEAIEANEARNIFLANMSHELHTPLNAVIGYSEILMEDVEKSVNPTSHSDLGKINSAGKHLLKLIDSILDLAKIESGKVKLNLENFPISTLVFELDMALKPVATKSSNAFSIEVDETIDTMTSDISIVRLILTNLLSNAFKFTKEGTVVFRVSMEKNGDRESVIFLISDDGPGMSNIQAKTLFQPFLQADSSTTKSYSGIGVGLATSHRFCQLLGGNIEVESQMGQGTQIKVSFPKEIKGKA